VYNLPFLSRQTGSQLAEQSSPLFRNLTPYVGAYFPNLDCLWTASLNIEPSHQSVVRKRFMFTNEFKLQSITTLLCLLNRNSYVVLYDNIKYKLHLSFFTCATVHTCRSKCVVYFISTWIGKSPNQLKAQRTSNYRATRMHSADHDVAICLFVRLSARLSVCLSVCHTPVFCLNSFT